MIYRLGELIESFSERCGISDLSMWDISGINIDKEFFEPARQAGSDTSNYKNVPPGYFACNLMHVGRDVVLPVALNDTDKNKIVSPAYTVFRIKDNIPLINEYFFMFLKSPERDRYFWFHADSSVRDGMPWEDFCKVKIFVPPIEIQRKYAGVYTAMTEHQRNLSRGLDDLRLVCDMYIEDLRRKLPCEKLGDYIELSDDKNESLCYGLDDVRGVSISKSFIETVADMRDVNLKPYYIVRPNNFAFNAITSRMGDKLAIALNETNDTYICSQTYVVFRCRNENELLPEYLMINFLRSEFDRYARFNSWGSAREVFSFSDMCEIRIPIPDMKIQRSIANIYTAYQKRKSLSERLKALIKDVCPVLIKGATDEAKQSAN